ncbi:NADH dehydrogenase [Labilithrix luteola]|uniref:NADH:ubiquinone reductase (non-electrogenic) n=1 Tax=Labilithrix luteola TaxID=1391654 RepID=A0A0K1PVW1_9BACT|nr:NAD(P)/FAD-dependent oxidoreductase [Labilithrix luteola]AKU97526.1 NADH dehydrogenase [Labilithrix luteola]
MEPFRPALKPGQKHAIVIGGGFGGLAAAKRLSRSPGLLRVSLIDQRNHHLFQPLLYQVATAGLNPSDIAVPIRTQFSEEPEVSVHLGRVENIDLEQKFVEGKGGVRIAYDYLIVATGAQHSYFGKEGWEDFAPGLKTVEQATEIRRRVLSAFEAAENEPDPTEQHALLNFVIVGGGPTGVELAGAIADLARTVLVKDFRRINPADARVTLIEAGPRVLAAFDEDLSHQAATDLGSLGVEVRVDQRVDNIDANGVRFGNEFIPSRSVFWAAGVTANVVTRTLGVPVDRAGRVMVEPDLSIPGHPEAFVIGDAAHLEIDGQLVPGLAPAAIQEGRLAADNILALTSGAATQTFRYVDKGTMATIGKHKAIGQRGRMKLHGYIAWVAWLFVHVFLLTGFKNRVQVFLEWTWSYLFSRRGARLITTRDWHTHAPAAGTLRTPTDSSPGLRAAERDEVLA